jgi:hypothetical protein
MKRDRVIIVPNIYIDAMGERATIEEIGIDPEDWSYLYIRFDNTKLGTGSCPASAVQLL